MVQEDSEAEANNITLAKGDPKNWKVAICHYWFVRWRGGEKVVLSILKLFPKADIYTLFCDPEIKETYLKSHHVYTSSLDLRWLRKHYQKIFPLYPLGIKSLNLIDHYDLIISSESGPAKGIVHPQAVPHLCYVHTPMRYCWGYRAYYLNSMPKILRPFASLGFEKLKRWDKTTVSNVNSFLCNSKNVVNRVKKYYHRAANLCYPPIDLHLFEQPISKAMYKSDRKFYLSFGAITPYKNISLLVETFNKNGLPLLVIGDGSEKKNSYKSQILISNSKEIWIGMLLLNTFINPKL